MQQKIGRWLRGTVNRLRGGQNIQLLIGAGLELGAGGMILDRSYIDPSRPWLIKIGAQVGISSYVRVLAHDDRMKIQTGFTRIAPVEIGDRVFVGVGATVLPGTRIGADSIIAAGAVVSGDIPPGSMVAGHPARVVTTAKRLLAWQRAAMANAPVWPMEGWTLRRGITAERKASQREALATVREGYAGRRASGRRVAVRSKLAQVATRTAAIDWRGIRPRRLTPLIANRLRGHRSVERHVREGLQLGERAFVADAAFLDPGRPWLITIGADSFISPHVIIFTHDSGLHYQEGLTRIGRADIGSRVYIGPGALVLPGSQIGDDSVIEAGAVVRGAIPPRSYVAGNPAAVVSDTTSIVEDWRRAATTGPSWPYEGWSSDSGITEERKRAQREALSSAPEGFLLAASLATARESAGSSYVRLVADASPRSGLSLARVLAKVRGERTVERLVDEGLELGDGVSVARHAYLDPSCPWLITIGAESIISEFAIVMAHDPGTELHIGATRLARVVIGRRAFIGPGAIILPGTTIGDDSVIDARAVVSGEIPPRSFVSGNPGRIVGDVETMAEQCRQAATAGPTWPYEDRSTDDGTPVDHKRAQRDALAAASEGYVRAPVRVSQRT